MTDDDNLNGMTPREWGHATTKEILAGLEEALRRVQGDFWAVLKAVKEKVKDAEERLTDIQGSIVGLGMEWDRQEQMLDLEGRLGRHVRRAEADLSDIGWILHDLNE